MRAGGRPWEASLPPVLCTVPLRPGCPLVHVCNASDGMGGGAWGKEGWGPDPTEISSEEHPHPRVKGASGWGASGQGPNAFSHSVGLSLLNCWGEEKKKLQLASPA